MKLLPIFVAFVFTALLIGSPTASAISFITIDLSSTLNPNDFPYAIDCSADPNFVFVTISAQGILAKIDKITQAVTLIPDPEIKSGGQDFYSIANDGAGNLFINERDNGELWRYNIAGDSWTRAIIMEEIIHPDVSYPNGYTVSPNLIKINEPTHGFHTYLLSANSFGGITFTDGKVWTLLNYNLNFDSFAESIGVTDVIFNGIVETDPTTLSSTRITLPVIDARGITIDSTDPKILWITSQADDTLLKFDLNTKTVTDSIILSAGSNPRGIDDDTNFLYIALNKPAGGNSEILKVDKSNLSIQTIIDTLQPNTSTGTFTTFIVSNLLIWTDQSNHVGSINLGNDDRIVFTTTDTNSNHFGCLVGLDFWFAGLGSAKVGIFDPFDFPEPEDKKKSCDALEKAQESGKGKKKGLEKALTNNDC